MMCDGGQSSRQAGRVCMGAACNRARSCRLELAHQLLERRSLKSEPPMSMQHHDLHAIDPDLMSNVFGGAESALSQLKSKCPTPESYDTSAECKKADAHYLKVIQAITRPRPAAAVAAATLAPAHH
jgi:hypothetical protein